MKNNDRGGGGGRGRGAGEWGGERERMLSNKLSTIL